MMNDLRINALTLQVPTTPKTPKTPETLQTQRVQTTPAQLHTLRNQQGFTLLELIMALVIVGILAALALPSFQDTLRRNRVINVNQQFQTAIMLARSESMKRGTRITIAPNNVGPVAGFDWLNGWSVYEDAWPFGMRGPEDTLILQQEPLGVAGDGYFLSLGTQFVTGQTVRVLTFVQGRPLSFAGGLQPFGQVIGLTDQAAGGTNPNIVSAKFFRVTCVAVTGRIRTIRPEDNAGAANCPFE